MQAQLTNERRPSRTCSSGADGHAAAARSTPTSSCTFTGRWARELHPVRVRVATRRVHRARTVAAARRTSTRRCCSPARAGFGEWRGAVWGAHLAWSGNHALLAERLADGRRYIQARRAAAPRRAGRSSPARSYRTPEVVAVHSRRRADGRHAAVPPPSAGAARPIRRATPGARQHVGGGLLRSRPRHPARRSPTAPPRSASNASCSTTAGSGHGRDDTSGLGDWVVSADAHPAGLGPLIDHVTGRSAWSSASGSSPRWSTPTATCTAPTPTGRWRPTATSPCSAATSWCSTSPRPGAYDHVLGQLDALLARPRHRLRQVGHEPRPHRRSAAPVARPAPTPRRWRSTGCSTSCAHATRRRDRVVLVGRRPHRPRDPAHARCGCGPATATTRSSARRSSAARRC